MNNLDIRDETSQLELVVLGIGESFGDQSSNNPKSTYHRANNTYPMQDEVINEVRSFQEALEKHGVVVLRPANIDNKNQIFTRDIGFVIDDFFVRANMKKESRKEEINAIESIISTFDPTKILHPPEDSFIEGGDIILWKDHIFVGKSDRTNDVGYVWLKEQFPRKEVIQIPVVVSNDYRQNILHLDCAFQPIGDEHAILYLDGFDGRPDAILDCFTEKNLIHVNQQQMIDMYPNIFSISKSKVVVEKSFRELRAILSKIGFEVIDVTYAETSKFSGLLRCSTLPLRRRYSKSIS